MNINEREDMVAPPLPKPNTLTKNEEYAVANYLKQGADIHALADYYGTTAQAVRDIAEKYGVEINQ